MRLLPVTNEERDAEDARLIAAGDYARLFAAYYPVLRDRLRLRRVPHDRAEEILQDTFLRLWRELTAGKQYSVPFRVVAHQVVRWTASGGEQEQALPLEEWDGHADDPALEDALHRYDLRLLLRDFPPRVGDVMWLRYGEGLEIEEIARRAGMERNAVDQALHRGVRRMREMLT